MMVVEWKVDEYGILVLEFEGPRGPVRAWIAPRPLYCDRGYWEFNVERGVPSLDGQDGFPRYFMSLQMAINEANAWLNWRLHNKRVERQEHLNQSNTDGLDLVFKSPSA